MLSIEKTGCRIWSINSHLPPCFAILLHTLRCGSKRVTHCGGLQWRFETLNRSNVEFKVNFVPTVPALLLRLISFLRKAESTHPTPRIFWNYNAGLFLDFLTRRLTKHNCIINHRSQILGKNHAESSLVYQILPNSQGTHQCHLKVRMDCGLTLNPGSSRVLLTKVTPWSFPWVKPRWISTSHTPLKTNECPFLKGLFQ